MPIKQSTLEKKWYYRVGKVILLAVPTVAAALVVVNNIQHKDVDGVIYALVALVACLLAIKLVWRIVLYLIFGGLENDIRQGRVKTGKQPSGQAGQPSGSGPSALSEEDKKQIGFYLFILFIIAIIYYAYFIWKPTGVNGTNKNGGGGGTACVSTGCGSQWYCNGTYYENGVQKRINGCVSQNVSNVYGGWSGTCRRCP